MKHVDIYITHNVRGFKTEHGTYGYTLAFQKQDGELKTLEDYASVGETTPVSYTHLDVYKRQGVGST